ncbi:MAG: SRPBCC family protein [Planctomycetota bacterium]
MPLRYEHAEPVDATPAAAFALIDDLPRTNEWLPPCVSLTNVTGPPNKPGDKLHYVFKQGGKQQEMEGEIVERVENEKLVSRYDDKAFTVVVDLRVTADGAQAVTHHAIEITPKSLMGKLFSPLIKLGLKKQTTDAATNLKRILEAGSA